MKTLTFATQMYCSWRHIFLFQRSLIRTRKRRGWYFSLCPCSLLASRAFAGHPQWPWLTVCFPQNANHIQPPWEGRAWGATLSHHCAHAAAANQRWVPTGVDNKNSKDIFGLEDKIWPQATGNTHCSSRSLFFQIFPAIEMHNREDHRCFINFIMTLTSA